MLSKYIVQALAISGLAFAQNCKFSSNVLIFVPFDARIESLVWKQWLDTHSCTIIC